MKVLVFLNRVFQFELSVDTPIKTPTTNNNYKGDTPPTFKINEIRYFGDPENDPDDSMGTNVILKGWNAIKMAISDSASKSLAMSTASENTETTKPKRL